MSIKLSGKIRQLEEKKVPEREHNESHFFPMKKRLILTASITVKMVVYGPFIRRKQVGEMEKNRKQSLQKK